MNYDFRVSDDDGSMDMDFVAEGDDISKDKLNTKDGKERGQLKFDISNR